MLPILIELENRYSHSGRRVWLELTDEQSGKYFLKSENCNYFSFMWDKDHKNLIAIDPEGGPFIRDQYPLSSELQVLKLNFIPGTGVEVFVGENKDAENFKS